MTMNENKQAEPVAFPGDALRWTLNECKATQTDNGVFFPESELAKLALILARSYADQSLAQKTKPPVFDNDAAWDLAQKVRTDLDRKSCPGAFMDLAMESINRHYTHPAPAVAQEPVAHYGIIDPDYARVFTQARCIAWQYGYACVMQGSFTRDLDLLMVPWTEQAKDNREQLLKLIAMACDLRFSDGKENAINSKADFTQQPHGRTSCSLHFPKFGDRRWIDVSFFPVQTHPTPAVAQDSVIFEAGKAAGRQEVKDAQSEPDFWAWVRKAYREPESTNFTIHNMEVAYQAGRVAAEAEKAKGSKHD